MKSPPAAARTATSPSAQSLATLHREAQRILELEKNAPREAHQKAQQLVARARDHGDQAVLALAYARIARTYSSIGEYSSAISSWFDCFAIGEALQSYDVQIDAMNGLGEIALKLGDYDDALERFARGLQIAEKSGHTSGEFTIKHNIAVTHEKLDHADVALRYFEEALALARARGDEYSIALVQNGLSRHYLMMAVEARALGDVPRMDAAFNAAQRSLQHAWEVALKNHKWELYSAAFHNAGRVLRERGRLLEASAWLERLVKKASSRNVPDRVVEVRALLELGEIAAQSGDVSGALSYFDTARQSCDAVAQRQPLLEERSRLLLGLSRAFEALAQREVEVAGPGTRTAALERALAARLKALEFHIEHMAVTLEIRRVEVQRSAANFTVRLDLERAKREFELLRAHSSDLELQNQSLDQLSRMDGLTKIANRRALDAQLETLHAAALAHRRPLSVALFDADRFKLVNDRFGHAIGDLVLRQLAATVGGLLRGGDFVARYGGEEFCVLFPQAELPRASEICERLRAAIEEFDWSEIAPGLKVTASFGVAGFSPEPVAMMKAADAALYRAKAAGRNRVELA